MDSALSPSDRTTATRSRERMRRDRAELHALLGAALVGHVGLSLEDHPVVLPVAIALDLAGPDEGGTLYLHGSVGAGWLRRISGAPVCVTVTELDGLVLARSAMHHSMNYRSAVVIGRARVVSDLGNASARWPGWSTRWRPAARRRCAPTRAGS